jgi:type VI secretion system protein ImpL
LLRRIALATVGVIALIFAIGFLVSFIGNLSLEHAVRQAADDVSLLRAKPGQTPTSEQLQTLDRLRQQLETISAHKREGPPFHLRWWLYSGEDLYLPSRVIYFNGFRDLLFAETQGKLLNIIRNVKDRPAPGELYEATYNPLKAYLITTSNPEKSTQEFLPPLLYKTWADGKVIGDDGIPDLARRQFNFYGSELPISNPFPAGQDAVAIARARAYLKNFAGIDLYYSKLKLDASEKVPTASFNRQFRDTADVVVSSHDVEGAFTPEGFKRVQDAIANNRIANEDWVVGKNNAQQLDSSTLQQQLRDRYYKDYIQEWRTVLQTSAVRPNASLHDADAKLGKLTSPSSPILELFWFVSHNTHVPLQQISDSFQPIQSVVPDGPPNQYVLAANQSYMTALDKVKSQIKSLADSPTGAGDANLVNQALSAAGEADTAVDQIAQKFNVDPTFHIEAVAQALLKQPIEHARAVVSVAPKEPVNGAGKSLCNQLTALTIRFPFNPNSSDDVSLDQLNMIFAPGTGSLWTTYKDKWALYLHKEGSRYVANNGGNVKITDTFLAFFNRAAGLSDALYGSGSPTPRVSYSLTQVASNIEGLTLKVGNETLSGTGQSKNFLWIGASEDVLATSKDVAIDVPHSGTWAIFHFIYDGHPAAVGGGYNLNFVRQSNGQDITFNGKRQSYSYQLHFSGADPLVDFGRLNCVSQVAR